MFDDLQLSTLNVYTRLLAKIKLNKNDNITIRVQMRGRQMKRASWA